MKLLKLLKLDSSDDKARSDHYLFVVIISQSLLSKK